MRNSLHTSKNGGYALITSLIFFLAATTAVMAALSDGIVREMRSIRNESASKQSYFASESALEDSIYRIKNVLTLDSTESLTIASSTATTTMTLNDDDSRTVSSTGNVQSAIRTLAAKIDATIGVYFPYAIHGGVGGIDLSGGATVSGDAYTLGSIRGCSECYIDGMAVAAGQTTVTVDQSNASPSVPTHDIVFGDAPGTQDLAQSFAVSSSLALTGVEMYIKKIGSPANATVRITTDNNGNPTGTILASGTLSSSLASTSYGWYDVTLTSNPVLTAGTAYWIVIDANTNASSYYVAGGNTSAYSSGFAKIGRFINSFNVASPADLDMYFRVSLGDTEEGIQGESQWNQLPVQSAYSHNATYVTASGDLFCQVGLENNKECDTSRGLPVIEEDPISEEIIDSWKSGAEIGGIHEDDLEIGEDGLTLGPRKIDGNLIVNGGTLNVSGTIWVTGSVVIIGGAIVQPDDNSHSYAIIADGTITISGEAEVNGGEHNRILLLSTINADPAISVDGGVQEGILFAPNGALRITGNADVQAGGAEYINANDGSNITFDPDVSQLNFDSGIPGAEYRIKSWKETE